MALGLEQSNANKTTKLLTSYLVIFPKTSWLSNYCSRELEISLSFRIYPLCNYYWASKFQHNFQGRADQSGTYSALASTLKKNGHAVINDRPCKIVELSNDQEEVHLTGIDIFNGKKQEDSVKHDANVDVPHVSRREYQLSHIDEDFLYLITTDGGEKSDVPVPEGYVGDIIREYEEYGTDAIITVISAMNEEAAISAKEAPKN
ncbi:hypothetical protein FSST1_002891 [Fusarium sambucinum]